MDNVIKVNLWKNLDLTAKYAQLNTLRKLASDISFANCQGDLTLLIDARIKSLQIDLHTLFQDEIIVPITPLNVESVCVA